MAQVIEQDDMLDEIHPGEILREEFMKPLGLTTRGLASDINVPPSRINDIVHGTRPISVDTALRLGIFFEMEPRFWVNLQSEYDVRVATRNLKDKITQDIATRSEVSAKRKHVKKPLMVDMFT
jgi:antitoxin HigA-1